MNIDNFGYKDFLPYYLTEDQKLGLARALRDFSPSTNIFTQGLQDNTLQGDCWEGVPYMDFSGAKANIKVLLVSNSCDIDTSNTRHTTTFLSYAPLIDLNAYEKLLNQNLDHGAVAAKIESIKAQKITNLVYVPASVAGTVDSVALLDRIISVPIKLFQGAEAKRKVFSLNQVGFYLLSFKLSIHFCRMHEGLVRG